MREQVGSGRYRTASEVVRDGLRLLEEREHARLLERALYDVLSPDEASQLPAGLLDQLRGRVQALIDAGVADRDAGRTSDGAAAMERIRSKLPVRRIA